MATRKVSDLRYSDVTPRQIYLNRRRFLAAATMGVGALSLPLRAVGGTKISGVTKSPLSTTEQPTPYEAVTGYNNFYEFGTGKDEPVKLARNFRTSTWTVSLEGE